MLSSDKGEDSSKDVLALLDKAPLVTPVLFTNLEFLHDTGSVDIEMDTLCVQKVVYHYLLSFVMRIMRKNCGDRISALLGWQMECVRN